MGVCTKGVVLTDCKNVMLICALIERSLDRLIDCERRFSLKNIREAKDEFSHCSTRLMPSSGMAQIDFTYKAERRAMSIFFDCDGDHVELAKKSVSMSMGCSGHSVVFIKTALHALSVLGPTHYDYSDSDEIPLAPLDEYTPTVMQMLRLRYLTAPRIESLVALYDEGRTFPKGSFRKIFGTTREWLDGVLGMPDFKDCWETLENAGKRQDLPELKFMSEHHSAAAVA